MSQKQLKRDSQNQRSLSWQDSTGVVYNYYESPMTKACMFILIQEMCERLAFYGIIPNLQTFLSTSLGITSNHAGSMVNIFNGLIYFTPFLSAILADTWLGTYATIIIFSVLYMAGLALLCISALTEAAWMIYVSLFVLIAIGAGGIKSCVNVMGASQFHPIEHSKDVTRFFTFFYAAINVGGIVGGITVPLVQQVTDSYFIGYLIPLGAFVIATIVFILGSPRYVKMSPQGSQILQIFKAIGTSIRSMRSIQYCKHSNGGKFADSFIDDAISLGYLLPLFALTVPFNICYNQMCTVFLTQGEKMHSTFFGQPMTPSLMQNVDPIAVVVFSFLVEYFLYAKLRMHNMMPSVLTRFFLGCCMGTISLLCAMGVEMTIMGSPDPQVSISIWWQVPQFCFIALGEIFLISTSYEVAFTYSPESMKAVGSALNLLFLAIASFISAALLSAFSRWMPVYDANVPSSWQTSHFDYFFIVLASLCFASGIISLCLNPYFEKHIVKPIDRKRVSPESEATATPSPSVDPSNVLIDNIEIVSV